MISHRALDAITARALLPDVFSELRIGTLLRNAGFEPQSLPPGKQLMNSFDRSLIRFNPARA
jgi:hypothetical protein